MAATSSDDDVQSIMDMLSVSRQTALQLMEMAGGDQQLAIALHFDSAGQATDDAALPSAGQATSTMQSRTTHPGGGASDTAANIEFAGVLWPDSSSIPAAWLQRLDNFDDEPLTLDSLDMPLPLGTKEHLLERFPCIRQIANGPCGVLAVLQGEMWLAAAASPPSAQLPPRSQRLRAAVEKILRRVQSESESLDAAADLEAILTPADLVRAIVNIIGIAKLKQSGAVLPLVEGPFWLCGADLLTLLLRGTVGGNVSAYNTSGEKSDFYSHPVSVTSSSSTSATLGLLSIMEVEEGLPIADDLKKVGDSAKCESSPLVWLLHTGDHFTTVRLLDSGCLHHYNGLPRTRRHTFIRLTGDMSPKAPAPSKHEQRFRKPMPGHIEDIVQAKRIVPDDMQSWKFEVILAVDDPTVTGPVNDDPLEPIFDLPSASDDPELAAQSWRCASCYRQRYQTMCFGMNESGAVRCQHCGKGRDEAGWTLWFDFADLPDSAKKRAKRMFASKLHLALSTRWPEALFVDFS